MQTLRLPLEGLKVIELSTVVATPITARLLSDYGAEVIKVEIPPYGDLQRPNGKGHMLPAEDGNNPLFDAVNSGKHFITLNLKTEEGMRIFRQLLQKADIFLTNVRMQSLEKMKIDYASLKGDYPKLIYAHFSGFGLEGEERNKPGFDTTAFWMRSGASVDISTPGAFPLRPSYAFGDIATSSEFLAAILMAVIGREKTGKGTMVTTSLLQSAIWCNITAILNSQPQYGKEYPVDRYHPWDPFSDYYRCKDGEWVAFMEKNYDADRFVFARLFDFPELTTDPELASFDRMRDCGRIPDVAERLEKVMLTKDSSEWMALFKENDIATEKAGHFRDISKDPQARANGCFDDIEYPDGSVTAQPTPPFRFSGFDRKPFQKTGAVGRDNEKIFQSLGIDEETIQSMKKQKII